MPVLILTARDRWSDKVQGFDAGADDYVAKPFHLEEVLARIRALLRRSTGHAQSELTCGPVSLDTRTGRVSVSGNPIKMTSHEYRLLAYLMHHTGRVVSRTELVEHLYDQDFDRDSNTIEVFVGRIRKKLDVDIIQTVRGLGYLLTPPSPTALDSNGIDQAPGLSLLFEHDPVRKPASIRRAAVRGHAFRDDALMRGSSLATRLFLSATAWVVVILVITGIVLSSVYRDATERAFDRRLNLYLRTLIAEVATPDEPPDRQFQSLGEPLFELPLSGWYWQITRTDADKAETRASRSLWDKKLPKLEEHGADLTAAGVRLGYVDGPEGQTLRMVERPVDLGADGKFLVSVAGDATEIFDETRSFDYYLGGTFAALAIVLLLTTIFQVRFGLAPLKRISDSIADIRSGRAERLEGEFPVEIAPLARETNALIDANREIVERARTHVGNLAHAIKTPLSVIVNEASAHGADPFATKVLEQADVMRDQVAHHLERARIAARLTIIGTVTEVAPAIEALRRTMEKIHRDRGVVIEVEADAQAKFRGERQDLEEMAGNLVDNACKWAASQVFIEVLVERRGRARRRPDPADHRRRRRARAVGGRARAGLAPRPAAGRIEAGLRAWAVDRGRPRGPLWRQPFARQRADRGTAGRTGAAGGVS